MRPVSRPALLFLTVLNLASLVRCTGTEGPSGPSSDAAQDLPPTPEDGATDGPDGRPIEETFPDGPAEDRGAEADTAASDRHAPDGDDGVPAADSSGTDAGLDAWGPEDVPDAPVACPVATSFAPAPSSVCVPSCRATGAWSNDQLIQPRFTLTVGATSASLAFYLSIRCGSTTRHTESSLAMAPGPTPGTLRPAEGTGFSGALTLDADCRWTGTLRTALSVSGMTCPAEYPVTLRRHLGPPVIVGPTELVLDEGAVREELFRVDDPDCAPDSDLILVRPPWWARLVRLTRQHWSLRLAPGLDASGATTLELRALGDGARHGMEADDHSLRVTVREVRGGGCLRDGDCPACYHCRAGACRLRQACGSEEACPGDSRCHEGECERRCATHAQCPLGAVCADGRCQRHPTCADSRDCRPGEACRGGRCTATPCARDAECRGTEVCLGGACQHVPCAPCPSGLGCGRAVDGGHSFCTRRCVADGDCPAHLGLCHEGLCVERRPCVVSRRPAVCDAETPCGAGEVCVGSDCVAVQPCLPGRPCLLGAPSCASDTDCWADHRCMTVSTGAAGVRLCVLRRLLNCATPADCPGGGSCWNGVCACPRDGGSCGEGNACVSYAPIPPAAILVCMSTRDLTAWCPPASVCVGGMCRPPASELPRDLPCRDRCDGGRVCDVPRVDCGGDRLLTGVCRDLPRECPAPAATVCGCDGRTYPSDCERFRASVPERAPGACGASP